MQALALQGLARKAVLQVEANRALPVFAILGVLIPSLCHPANMDGQADVSPSFCGLTNRVFQRTDEFDGVLSNPDSSWKSQN